MCFYEDPLLKDNAVTFHGHFKREGGREGGWFSGLKNGQGNLIQGMDQLG